MAWVLSWSRATPIGAVPMPMPIPSSRAISIFMTMSLSTALFHLPPAKVLRFMSK
ncbi:GM17863 [Drosophila sechellia]|uniref:GM17863 n=1 Tax=Drosophila sechellia TaxID=7238 RepID=B4I2A4_DROSE|nr:GM17863 [Drosophila sechellia]